MICFFNAEVFDGKCPDGFHGYVVVEGERIKEVGCGDRNEWEMRYFYEQSSIWEKYIKEVGCRGWDENAIGIFLWTIRNM